MTDRIMETVRFEFLDAAIRVHVGPKIIQLKNPDIELEKFIAAAKK